MSKQSEFTKCLMAQIGGYRKKIHGEEFFSPRQKELFPGLKRDLNMEIEDAARSDDPLEACMERRGYKPSKTQVFQDAISAKLTADMFGKQEKLTGAEAMFQEQMQECLDRLKNRPKLKFGLFNIKTAPIWELNPSMYLSQQNIHEPWIAEIAPTQYARMSKRAKAEYDQKRHREWEASAKGKSEWKAGVWQAFKEGKFNLNTPNISKETKDIIILKEAERKQSEKSFETQKIYNDWTHKTNVHFQSFEELKPGDRVWNRFNRGYYKVIKVNPKSVRMETEELYKPFGKGELRPITTTHKYIENLTRLSPEDEKIEFEKFLSFQLETPMQQKLKKRTIPEQTDFINPSQMTLFGRLIAKKLAMQRKG
jgi:hypothetical protein